MSTAVLLSSYPDWLQKENSSSQVILAHEENVGCRQSHTKSEYNTHDSLMSMSFPFTHGIFVFQKIYLYHL